MKRILAGLLLLAATAPAPARECGEGGISGGLSAQGDALQNAECRLLARVYCRIAEDRDAGMSEAQSSRRTVEWLQHISSTGSHQKGNWRPIVELAAADVFRRKQRRPGPTYYRAAYSCGVAKRTAGDPQAQRAAGPAFEQAADACEAQHPMTGARSYPNPRLRDCLAAAVERVAPVAAAQR